MKHQITVEIDDALLRQVDALTGDRAQAIEEGLRLWCQQNQRSQRAKPQTTLDYLRQRHDEDETGWLV